VKTNHESQSSAQNFEGKVISAKTHHVWNFFFMSIYNLKLDGLTRWRVKAKKLSCKEKAINGVFC